MVPYLMTHLSSPAQGKQNTMLRKTRAIEEEEEEEEGSCTRTSRVTRLHAGTIAVGDTQRRDFTLVNQVPAYFS